MKPHNPFYVSMLLLLSAVLVSVFAQQPPRTLSTVDAELSKICGESEERASYSERLQLIHRLPSNLAPEQLADFLGYNENAVRWQVWTALLTNLLLRFVAWHNKWKHPFSRLFTLVRGVLWNFFRLSSIIEC